jgi:hypothetical protein
MGIIHYPSYDKLVWNSVAFKRTSWWKNYLLGGVLFCGIFDIIISSFDTFGCGRTQD